MKKVLILFAVTLMAISSVCAIDSFRFNAYYIKNTNNDIQSSNSSRRFFWNSKPIKFIRKK